MATSKKTTKKPGTLYKVLVDGTSMYGRLEWSLPTADGPGDWHEVEGDIVRCENGLHLTDNPVHRWREQGECYLVETEGPVLHHPDWGDEHVARKVRLLRRLSWAELAEVGIRPRGDDELVLKAPPKKGRAAQPLPPPKGPSAAMQFVRCAWDNRCKATAHSWRTVNSTMRAALALAITGGMSFAAGDVAEIYRSMRGCYWFGDEQLYSTACEEGNLQACQSFEAWQGRKPFLWEGKRLHVGRQLLWEGIPVKVTSFQDDKGALIACSYKSSVVDRWREGPLDRRFTITNDELARAEKDRKTEATLASDATVVQKLLTRDCGIDVDHGTIVDWTPEERAAVVEWVALAKHDARKSRVKMPEPPPFLAEDVAKTEERRKETEIRRLTESLKSHQRSIRDEQERIQWAQKRLAVLRGEASEKTKEAA